VTLGACSDLKAIVINCQQYVLFVIRRSHCMHASISCEGVGIVLLGTFTERPDLVLSADVSYRVQ